MAEPATLTQDHVQQRFTDGLRLFVGQGRRFSVAGIAAATSIPERTIKAYQAGETLPGLAHFMRLCMVLPPEFGDHMMAIAGLGGLAPLTIERANGHRTTAVLAETLSHFAEAGADGIYDHREKRELAVALRAAMPKLEAFCRAVEVEAA